jgi:hypothetical protein
MLVTLSLSLVLEETVVLRADVVLDAQQCA